MGRQAKSGEFRTFSLRFQDAEFDETRFQRQMAERLDSRHEEIEVARADIANIFPEVIRHTERPVPRTAPAAMYLLSELVRKAGIKSVLTGEGADEVLAGYDIFREAKIRRFWAKAPDSTRRPLPCRQRPLQMCSIGCPTDLRNGFPLARIRCWRF